VRVDRHRPLFYYHCGYARNRISLVNSAPPSSVAVDERSRRPLFWPRLLRRLAFLSLLVYCTLGSVAVTIEGAWMIRARRDTTFPESVNAYLAILAVRSGQIYHSVASPPYLPQPFGPLFYAMNAVIARASNLDVDLLLQRGRLLSFGCFLLCGLVVFQISRRLEFSNTESTLAAMMCLAQPGFLTWNATMRPDVPALLAMLLCLLFALCEEQWGPAACIASGLLAGAAFLLKQSAAAAPIAIGAVFLLEKKYRQIVWFALSAATPLALALGILLWHREPFFEQFTAVSRGVWSLGAGAQWIMKPGHGALAIPLLIGGVGFLPARRESGRSKMIAAFALVSLCAGLATIPQVGGNINYFLPTLAGCALLLPFAMRVVVPKMSAAPAIAILASIVLLAGTAGGALECDDVRAYTAWTDASYEGLRSFKILSDDPYTSVHGRDPELLDPYTIHAFELTGHWNPSGVIESVQRGDYDLVILTHGRTIHSYRGISFFGPRIVSSLNQNYEVACEAGTTLVLKPQLREARATPEMLSSLFGPCSPSAVDRAPNLSFGNSTH
jgi:hypothetical protein